MILLKNISKSFDGPKGKVSALQDVGFELPAGEMLAISGPSGCGKTTLLLTAAGMLRPDSGTVELGGKENVYGLHADQRLRLRSALIGFVFQQFHLIPYLTVMENVMAPSLAMSRQDAGPRAMELLNQFGLQERGDHISSQLSTGERQRTALARALFNEPKIILADEPTGNLDDENADVVLKHLRQYVSGGGSVLLVTHNSRAADYATRTLKMKDGRIVNGQTLI